MKADIHFPMALLAVVTVAAAFCTGSCGKKPQSGPHDVTYRLKWLFNTSVVGDLYAQVHGIFANHGLQVTIKEGSPERDAIKALELGHAEFGVASADQVIRAASKGAPVVVIAQLFQANPLQWIYRPQKTAIQSVYDLKGKTIGVTYGGNDETMMKAILTKYDIKKTDVTFFSVRYDYTPFYTGEVDLWPVYQNAEGIIIGDKLRKGGEGVGFFRPDAWGVRFVANAVVTTEHLLRTQPETAAAFVRALLEGWRKALDPENEEAAVETIHQFDKDTPIHLIRRQLAATRRLVKPSPDMEVGRIDGAAWAQTERIMVTQKLIPGPVSLKQRLRSLSGAASPESSINESPTNEVRGF